MDLDPVDHFALEIRGLKTNSVIPLPLRRVSLRQAFLNVDAAPEISRMSGLNPVPVAFEQSLEARLPGPADIGCLLDGLLKR